MSARVHSACSRNVLTKWTVHTTSASTAHVLEKQNGCLFSILYVFPITGSSLVKWSFSLLFSQAQQRSSPSCCCENASLFSSVHVWNLSCKQTPESIRSGPNEMICWPTSLPVCTQCTLTDSENLDTFKL